MRKMCGAASNIIVKTDFCLLRNLHVMPEHSGLPPHNGACVKHDIQFSLLAYPNPYICFSFNFDLLILNFLKLVNFCFSLQNRALVEHQKKSQY
jgi:hypothetical protein